MRKFSPREKMLAGCAAAGVILTAAVYLFGSNGAISDAGADVAAKENLLRRYRSLLNNRQQIESVYKESKNKLMENSGAEEISMRLLQGIKDTAGRVNVDIEEVKPLSFKPGGDEKTIVIEVAVHGRFSAIFRMIQDIEDNIPLVTIAAVKMSPRFNAPQEIDCRLVLSRAGL